MSHTDLCGESMAQAVRQDINTNHLVAKEVELVRVDGRRAPERA